MSKSKEILDHLKDKDYDFISFLSGEKKDSVEIIASDYNKRGKSVDAGTMGEMYHIMLFRDHKTDVERYDDLDVFEAILIDPSEYISRLIPAGFYGVVGRKTTTSEQIFKKLLAKMIENVYN